MDGTRFDRFARAMHRATTRRRGVAIAIAALTGGALASDDAAMASRRTCRPEGASCLRNAQCCIGTCETRRTAPRNRRNRCVCIPNCDGKTCGSDGCGGSCGEAFPLLCGADGVAYSACEDFTPTLGDYGDAIFCESDIAGDIASVRAGWYPWGEDPCTTNAQCQLGPICDVAGYGCMCEGSWTDWETGDVDWDEDGATWCLLYRTAPTPCSAGIAGQPGCSETIEGDLIGNLGWAQSTGEYAGYMESCTSSADCVSKDSRCTDDDEVQCVCQLAWGYEDNTFAIYDFAIYDAGYCVLFYLEP